MLQGLNSANGDVTKDSQKYSTVGKTGFKYGSFEEAASTWRQIQTKSTR